MEKEETITPEQSLTIIKNMLNQAKEDFANDGGKIWIVWGWIVVIASSAQFVLILLEFYKWSSLPWSLTLVGAIYSIIYSSKAAKKAKIVTHVDVFMKYLWIAFGVSIFMIIGFCSHHSELVIPMCIVLYGLGTFVSGGALKFTPLKVGGTLCWIIALITYNVAIIYQLPLISLAVIVSYLIPGYMIRAQFKKDANV